MTLRAVRPLRGKQPIPEEADLLALRGQPQRIRENFIRKLAVDAVSREPVSELSTLLF